MAIANEVELPKPLDGTEIKDGIAFTIAAAIRESLDKTCHLYGKAYPKFKATWHVHYELDDFGRVVEGNIRSEMPVQEMNEATGEYEATQAMMLTATHEVVSGEIPETPPNQFRRDTEQPVPTMVTDRGRTTEKAVVYQPRRGRPRKAER